jgi:hypothetical protein
MTFWRQHPWFFSALLTAGAAIAGESAWLYVEIGMARREGARLVRTRRELHDLQAGSPAPSPENVAAVTAEVQRAEERIAALENELRDDREGRNEFMNNESVSQRQSTDTYFELASFVATMRERAGQLGIRLKPEEYFGFAEFAHAGPAPERAARIESEKRAVQSLLELLFAAAPKRLVAVQRERWGDAGVSANNGIAADAADDYFEPDSGRSLRTPGVVETMGFRLTFEAPTDVLRGFLVRLGRSRQPLVVVRSVEAAMVDDAEAEPSVSSAGGGPLLMVRASLSRFVVTVEVVKVADTDGPAA